MLLPHPNTLTFDGVLLPDPVLVTIDRAAAREVVEWSDAGPHIAFADVPEQRTTVTLVRQLTRGDLNELSPGRAGTLTFVFSAAGVGTDARRKRLTAACVVRDVRHELNVGGTSARQVITLIAVSDGGAADPVEISDM